VPEVGPFPDGERLVRAFGLEESLLPVELYDNGMRHVYALAHSPEQVAGLRPDLAALVDLDRPGSWGFNVSAGSGGAWKTRMFAPAEGVAEDPATGSAAGPLACHLARHGLIGWGEEIAISQGAEIGRPSTLYARADGGPAGITAVHVRGDAVIVGRGEFEV
jgi:trans-2,3-dihydro-3-hydroxyanthranilate isomerase